MLEPRQPGRSSLPSQCLARLKAAKLLLVLGDTCLAWRGVGMATVWPGFLREGLIFNILSCCLLMCHKFRGEKKFDYGNPQKGVTDSFPHWLVMLPQLADSPCWTLWVRQWI